MTPKEFLQAKYPQMRGDYWNSNETIEDNWVAQMMQEYKDQEFSLNGVVASLPTTEEINSRLKHVVENSFEDNEIVGKMEYSLGFRACYNWLKIKQMKSKG